MADQQQRARLYPRVTSFRSRRGSLTPAQQRNWENLWPRIGRDATTTEALADESPDEVATNDVAASSASTPQASSPVIDYAAWFGRSAPVILEIGCGTGTSTAAMAADEPHIDVIAVEVYRPGIAQLLGFIARENLTNIRLIRGDAVVVLREMITPESLAGVRIFFPDPWPKARHHKRRLIAPGTLELIATALADNAVLHIATDHADYAEWIDEHLAEQRLLVPVDGNVPFSLDRPTTKFEGRADREGRSVTEFVLRRIPREEPKNNG